MHIYRGGIANLDVFPEDRQSFDGVSTSGWKVATTTTTLDLTMRRLLALSCSHSAARLIRIYRPTLPLQPQAPAVGAAAD